MWAWLPSWPSPRARRRRLGSSGSGTSDGAVALAAAESDQPFAEPPRQQSENGVLAFDLVASDRGITVAGSEVQGHAYDDGIVGPTLVVNPGDTIALTLDNQLNAHTNIHFHGMHVSPRDNGDNIFLSVEPGEQFAYSLAIPDNHPSGTFWYHSHAHGISEPQVFGGLSGMIIVQGLTDLLPTELRDITDIAIGLKDAQVVGDAIEAGANIDSNAPTLRVVNSAHLPVQEIAPGEVQLWRVANIGADIWYDIELESGGFAVVGRGRQPRVGGVGCRAPRAAAGQAVRRVGDRARPPATTCSRPRVRPGRRRLSRDRPHDSSRRRAPRSTTPPLPASLVEPAAIDAR